MADDLPNVPDDRAQEARALYEETVAHVGEEQIEDAASSGESKVNKLEIKGIPKALTSLWGDVKLLTSLVRDYVKGDYRAIPFKSIAAITGAILYFVSPVDAIPDFIPVLGYLDDAVVLRLCLKTVQDSLQKYKEAKDTAKG